MTFAEYEKLGRDKFSKFATQLIHNNNIKSFKETKIGCHVDFLLNGRNNSKIAVEVKNCREEAENDYPTYFIKQSKFHYILQYMDEHNIKTGYYIFFYGSNMYSISFKKLIQNSTPEVIYIPHTNVYGGELEPTPIYQFPKSVCTKYTLDETGRYVKQ